MSLFIVVYYSNYCYLYYSVQQSHSKPPEAHNTQIAEALRHCLNPKHIYFISVSVMSLWGHVFGCYGFKHICPCLVTFMYFLIDLLIQNYVEYTAIWQRVRS